MRALAASKGATLVNCITTGNRWAEDVGLAACLGLGQKGYLAFWGMMEPASICPMGASSEIDSLQHALLRRMRAALEQ